MFDRFLDRILPDTRALDSKGKQQFSDTDECEVDERRNAINFYKVNEWYTKFKPVAEALHKIRSDGNRNLLQMKIDIYGLVFITLAVVDQQNVRPRL